MWVIVEKRINRLIKLHLRYGGSAGLHGGNKVSLIEGEMGKKNDQIF